MKRKDDLLKLIKCHCGDRAVKRAEYERYNREYDDDAKAMRNQKSDTGQPDRRD